MTHEEWLEERRKAIGASDSPGVLGVSPWSSPFAVWASKVGLMTDDFTPEAEERMRWGHLLEPVILEEYSERTGIATERHDQTQVVRHRSFPDVPMSCTPDAYDEEGRLVQVKTTSVRYAEQWRAGVPLHVVVQEQHEMAVVDAEAATVVVLIGGQQLLWYELQRHQAFIDQLEETLTWWWSQYVESREAPPVDGTAATTRILDGLHPADSGATIMLGNEFVKIDKRLQELRVQQRLLSTERDALENRIKAAIGGATFGQLPDGGKYSWKTQTRRKHVVATSTSRVLRRHQ